ncbi:MAG: GLUG motif-containing protein [Anaerovoracaceae bacterium]
MATYGTGGVTGRSVSASAEISESYNSGTVNSNTEATGGVVGYANAGGSSVKSCYNTGSIIITGGKTDKKVASKSGTKNSAKTEKTE